jgi:hypothetical protein
MHMGIKPRLVGIASIGLVVAFASSALAQGAVGSSPRGATAPSAAGAPGAGSAGALGPGSTGATPGGATGNLGSAEWPSSSSNFNTTNVSTTNPFGSIDVGAAGTTPESMRQWMQGRSASERAELQGRCGVITSSANTNRYPRQAQTFCRNYMTASNASPGGPGSTTTR